MQCMSDGIGTLRGEQNPRVDQMGDYRDGILCRCLGDGYTKPSQCVSTLGILGKVGRNPWTNFLPSLRRDLAPWTNWYRSFAS